VIQPLLLAISLVAGQGSVSSEDLDVYEASWRKSRKACGPIALSYCLRRLGRIVSAAELAEEAQLDPDGVSASKLLEASAKHGLPARALKGDPKHYQALPVPSILILDSRHCVVYDGEDADGQIRIFEPGDGQRKIAIRDRLSQRWTGEVIVFERPALTWFGFSAWATVAMGAVVFSAKTGAILLRRQRC
jgi:ABC-type bacteriocin/lantibiotic exporter with double-glycine peptidase domain